MKFPRSHLAVGLLSLVAALSLNNCGSGRKGGTSAPCNPATVTAPAPTGVGDPLFANQWHLANTTGEDVRVVPVWLGTPNRRGEGMRIAIVDDGLEITHEDLIANVVSDGSYDYRVPGVCSPTGGEHGTSVAGVAASRDDNGLGGRGAAPRASLVGYNLLAAKNDANEADAMTRDRVANEISSNSWGAPDDVGTLDAPAQTWYDAIDLGLAEGRDGKGLIYVWAAGNGGRFGTDNSNYDGQANYRGVIPVCAVGDNGLQADYSERGANLLVCAPSLGTRAPGSTTPPGITTTDRTGPAGYVAGNYFTDFSGTSSAAPLAAGVIALVLQAKPDLGWRDVRQILAKSARRTDTGIGSDWVQNSAGLWVSHKYGFGVINADAAVTLATNPPWPLIGPELPPFTQTESVNTVIQDGSSTGGTPIFGSTVQSSITISTSLITKIEFVDVILTSDHPYAGDLEVVLSKTGSVDSRLAEAHACPQPGCGAGYANGWRFGDMRHLDETANGTWTLKVRDGFAKDVGTFVNWTLRIHGRAN